MPKRHPCVQEAALLYAVIKGCWRRVIPRPAAFWRASPRKSHRFEPAQHCCHKKTSKKHFLIPLLGKSASTVLTSAAAVKACARRADARQASLERQMRRQGRAQRQAVSNEKAPFVERRNTDGAGDGTRTRGYQLGKLGPYHLATPAYVLSIIPICPADARLSKRACARQP